MKFRIEKPGILNLLANTVLFAAAGRDAPEELQVIRLNVQGRSVWTTATDRTAVGQAKDFAYEEDGGSWSALIGADDVRAAIALIKGARVMSVGVARIAGQVIFSVDGEHLAVNVKDGSFTFPPVEKLFPDSPGRNQDFDTACLSQGDLARAAKIRDYRWRMPLSLQISPGADARNPILFTAGKDFRGLFMPIIQPLEMRKAHDAAYNTRWTRRD